MNSTEIDVLDHEKNVEAAKTNTVLPLCQTVKRTLENYIKQLDGDVPNNFYDMVIREIEKPLFEVIMTYANGNQSKAADALGISRGTLRKKLKEYELDD